METDLASSYRTPYGFEKLNDGNYATWAFVKYQFLEEKLWGLVSGTEVAPTPPVQSVERSGVDETTQARVSGDTEAQMAYQIALSEWNDKVNAAYLIYVTTILGRLQAPVRQATSPADAWNRLRELHAPSGLQRRFALSRQLYSLRKEPSVSMQQHEITYDVIIEDLARAGKILDPEDLAITYLNTLPDTYSSLIQSMEPLLATLTSQNIKAKVREEEQRLKNVENGSSDHASAQSVVVAAHNAQSTSKKKQPSSDTSPKQARKKKGNRQHCGEKGHWQNECRKRIAEERALAKGNGTAIGTVGGAAIHSAALAIVANAAVAQTLLDAFVTFQNLVETEVGCKILAIRTDSGTEYQGVFDAHLKQHGIKHQVTTPHSPESNGVSERNNRTITEMVRPMLHRVGYPPELWGEAALTACYIPNRSPTSALVSGITPFEAWHNYKPDVSHLRRWGCIAYSHVPTELRKKLDPKGTKGTLVGYDNAPGNRIYDPVRRGIISTKDWIVSENEIWNFGTVTEGQIVMKTTISPPVVEDNEIVPLGSLKEPTPSPPKTPTVQSAPQSPVTETTPPPSTPSQAGKLKMVAIELPRTGAEGTRRERRQQLQPAAELPTEDSGTEGIRRSTRLVKP